MNINRKFKSTISGILAVCMMSAFVTNTFAAQHNEYTDPADVWMSTAGRTNELDMNATVTYETQYCPVCNKETTCMTYRVPEYTKSGQTALNHGVKYSDGTCTDGRSKGNLDSGLPGADAYYTGYHFTKSVCQACGTINAIDGPGEYNFNRNVYALNSCDHSFFLDFDNTTYEPYNSTYHTTLLKKGQYCQFCKGTYARANEKREEHNYEEVVDAQLGNNRFYVHEHCKDCDYETSEYVTAKSVVSSYYGNADGEAHTLAVSDLSDNGVKTSIRYGTSAENCNMTTAPNFTQAGYNTVYYKITYTYDGESMTENGVSYVWLLNEPETNVTILIPDTKNDKHEHDYRYIETVPSTCDNLGYERWQCVECGALEKKNYVQAKGHNYETVTIKEATCKEGGLTLHLCKDCGDFHTETTPTGSHHYHIKNVNPTCQSVGYTEHTCEICGDTYITDIQPLVSHSFEHITKEPTCTDKGYTTSICTVCGMNYVSDYTDPTGHDFDEGHTVTNSTCKGEGIIEYHCKNCDERMIKSTDANGHRPGADATCTEPQICEECGTILEIPKGHKYESTVIAPTCTSMGYTVYICEECGDTYTGDYTDKLPHDYKTEITNPTCTSNGHTTYTCANCGDEYVSDYTEKAPHNFKAVVTEPTCTEFGFTTYTCSDCGENYVSDYTDKTPHNYEETVVPPTCTNIGYKKYTCKDCGHYYVASYTDILRHKLSAWIIDEEATIEHSGTKHIECTVCGERLQTLEIPQLTDTDRTNEDGNAKVGNYAVIVTDKDGVPVFNSEIVIDVNDNITVKLPKERLLDYANQTTVTVMNTETNTGVKDVRIFIFDGNNNAATGVTNDDGQVRFPNNQSSTGDDNGTIGKDNEEAKETFVVRVTDKFNTIIPNCNIYLGESNNIVVDLPQGIRPSREEPVIIIVTDQNGVAKKDITIIAMGDDDYIEKGITDIYGKITIPAKTSSGGSSSGGSGSHSGGSGGGSSISANTTIIKITDKNGKVVTGFKKSIDPNGNVTITLPSGKTITESSYYNTTVTNGKGVAKENVSVTLKDKSNNSVTGTTDKNGVVMLPVEEHKAYIVGFEDGTFRPENNMTRAEAAAIFARLISDKKGESISGKSSFNDISSKDWFANEVGYLEKYNIIKGYEDNTFKPDAAVTRAEFVSMAVRYYALFNKVKKEGYTVNYTDIGSGYWAYSDIAYAKNIGWLNGYADGTFKGDNKITRAEVVTVVNRATDRNADKEYINSNFTKLNRFTDVKENTIWYFYDVAESANTHKSVKSADSEKWGK